MSSFKLPLKHIGEGVIVDAQDRNVAEALSVICTICDKRADEIVIAINNFEKMRELLKEYKTHLIIMQEDGRIVYDYLDKVDQILKETETK